MDERGESKVTTRLFIGENAGQPLTQQTTCSRVPSIRENHGESGKKILLESQGILLRVRESQGILL